MKRLGGVWPQVVSPDNLWLACRKACRGKRGKSAVARFLLEMEPELLRLRRDLVLGEYRPGGYRLFTIYDRKPRIIACAPFRDRVVHHALMNVIEPALDPTFIRDSYACRRGKGTHAAVARYQGWARRYAYALKMDVSRYFPSIDHDRLKQKLRARIKDRGVLWLLDAIIDGAPPPAYAPPSFPGDDLLSPVERRTGLPIGNLTSQFLGNLYLDALDHAVKEVHGVRAYLRYVDDMALLDDDKLRLHDLREAVRERLAAERLVLHPYKAHVTPVRDGLDLLGYRVYPTHRRLRPDGVRRLRRRIRALACAYRRNGIDWPEVDASVQSWLGHARHADTAGLREKVLPAAVFTRGAGCE